MKELVIREAVEGDARTIHALLGELADFERLAQRMTVTEDTLRADIFEKGLARAFLAEREGPYRREAVAFATVCERYSTFAGKRILFLEDIFVREKERANGVGAGLFAFVAETARAEGFAKMEWSVLSWNEGAKGFYRSRGGKPATDWEGWELEL